MSTLLARHKPRLRRWLLRLTELAAACLNVLPGRQTAVVLTDQPSYTSRGGDGLSTIHNAGFLQDPAFEAAYERGLKASGWDYGIPWRVHVALWAATSTREVDGDIVELGTGRGLVMSAVLAHLDWESSAKRMWLFDRFSPHWVDRLTGDEQAAVNPHYATDVDAVSDNFAEWSDVHVIQGEIPATLRDAPIAAISLLHVDLNAAQPEVDSVRQLWPRITRGGIMLLDDYANRNADVQHEAMDALARELSFHVLALPTGQGLVLKA